VTRSTRRSSPHNLTKSGSTPAEPGGAAPVGPGEPSSRGDYAITGDPALDLAAEIDTQVKLVRPDDWRGNQTRENVIKGALWGVLGDEAEVERIFLIVKAQPEY
jgi:type I restriction enzyme R subunit